MCADTSQPLGPNWGYTDPTFLPTTWIKRSSSVSCSPPKCIDTRTALTHRRLFPASVPTLTPPSLTSWFHYYLLPPLSSWGLNGTLQGEAIQPGRNIVSHQTHYQQGRDLQPSMWHRVKDEMIEVPSCTIPSFNNSNINIKLARCNATQRIGLIDKRALGGPNRHRWDL